MKQAGIIEIAELSGGYQLDCSKSKANFSINGYINCKKEKELLMFQYVDLSQCNSMDDVLNALWERTLDILVFSLNAYNFILLKTLFLKYKAYSQCSMYVWIMNGVEKPCKMYIDEDEIYVFPSNQELVQYLQEPYELDTSDDKILNNIRIDASRRHEDMQNDYKIRMSNGFNLFFTGKYPNDFVFSKAHHVFVENPDILTEVCLEEYMDLNSALIIPRDKIDINYYEQMKQEYYSHIHLISQDHIEYDGTGTKDEINKYKYSEFFKLDNKLHHSSISYVSIEDKEDYKCFVKDIELFSEQGIVRNPYFLLKNECRFANRCTLMYQRRFLLTDEFNIIPCIDGSKPIYLLSDDEYYKYTMRQKAIDETQIKRNCKDCSVKDRCTKCAFLPEQISVDDYCSVSRKYTNIQEFFNIKNALFILKKYSSFYSKAEDTYICFSNSLHLLLLNPKYKIQKKLDSNCYLFQLNKEYYCFNPMNAKIIMLGEGLAMILEAVNMGYSMDETFQIINERYEGELPKEVYKSLWVKLHKEIIA